MLDKKREFLIGKTIDDIRYMTEEEAEYYGWSKKPLVIFFDDGHYMFASIDSEGNNGGVIFTSADNISASILYCE